jgi:hypothetical protein
MVGVHDLDCEVLSSTTVNILMVVSFVLGFLFFRRFRVKTGDNNDTSSISLQMPDGKVTAEHPNQVDEFPIH